MPMSSGIFKHNIVKDFDNILFKLAEDWEKKYEEQFKPAVEEIAKTKKYPFKFMFKGSDRIIIPFTNISINKNEDDKDIINVLENNDYKVDWEKGIATKFNRTTKISKALKEIYKEGNKERLSYLLRNYEKSLSRAFFKNPKLLNIVISQNPHDIARMSYGRRWTSCMNLETGAYAPKFDKTPEERKANIFCEVEQGGLIAYVVTKDDKDIKKPLARILLRRFQNELGDSFLQPESKIYGLPFNGFVETVSSWLKENELDKPSKQLSLLFSPVYRLKGVPYVDTLGEWKVPEQFLESITYKKLMTAVPEDQETIVTELVDKMPDHPIIEEIVENSSDPNLLFVIATHLGKQYGPLFLANDNFWTNNAKFYNIRYQILNVIEPKFIPYFLEYEQNAKLLVHVINKLLNYKLSDRLVNKISERLLDADPYIASMIDWAKLSPKQLVLLKSKIKELENKADPHVNEIISLLGV